MEDIHRQIERKRDRLKLLLEQRSKANCDTRHLSPSDIKREEEIEELEEEIAEMEEKPAPSGREKDAKS